MGLFGQFTTDIQYIKGKNNIPADFLSRIESIRFPDIINYNKLKENQDNDEELKHLLKPSSIIGLKLKEFQHGFRGTSVYWDTSTNQIQP